MGELFLCVCAQQQGQASNAKHYGSWYVCVVPKCGAAAAARQWARAAASACTEHRVLLCWCCLARRSQAAWQLAQQQANLLRTARSLRQDAATLQRVRHASTLRLQYDNQAADKVSLLGLVWAHPWLPLKPVDSSRLSTGCLVLLSKAVGLTKTAVLASNSQLPRGSFVATAGHTLPSLQRPALHHCTIRKKT